MKIITDMERIGDQAADIAEIILAMLAQGYVPEDVGHIREMAAEVIKMVTESVDSYVQKDTVRAKLVIAHDDIVDGISARCTVAFIRRSNSTPSIPGSMTSRMTSSGRSVSSAARNAPPSSKPLASKPVERRV